MENRLVPKGHKEIAGDVSPGRKGIIINKSLRDGRTGFLSPLRGFE